MRTGQSEGDHAGKSGANHEGMARLPWYWGQGRVRLREGWDGHEGRVGWTWVHLIDIVPHEFIIILFNDRSSKTISQWLYLYWGLFVVEWFKQLTAAGLLRSILVSEAVLLSLDHVPNTTIKKNVLTELLISCCYFYKKIIRHDKYINIWVWCHYEKLLHGSLTGIDLRLTTHQTDTVPLCATQSTPT